VPLCSAVSSPPEASRKAGWWPATDAERLSVHCLGNGEELGRGYHEGSPQLYLRHGEQEDDSRRRRRRDGAARGNPGLRLTSWARGVITYWTVAACFARRSQASQLSTPQGNAYRLGEHGAFLKATCR
jgi:hypothetical protein